MSFRHLLLISAVWLVVLNTCCCQEYADNSVNEQDFDYQERPVPSRFQQRTQSSFNARTSFASPAQQTTRVPPVQILKQINRHNEDGSYTYGFEGGDGSFKIETKLPNGEVKGKYGYVDDSGKVRVVEYGANRYGFQPTGEGITVAPPTLVDETRPKKKKPTLGPLSAIPVNEEVVEYDDGQYYEEPEPQIPTRTAQRLPAVSRPKSRPAPPRPQPANVQFEAPQPQQRPQRPQPDFSSFPEQSFQQSFGSEIDRSSGPVSPTVQVSGAVPNSGSQGPTPPRISVPGAAPVNPRPAPQFLYQPAPQARQAPRATARQFSSGGFDELEKQFALPSNGASATHDITFGAF